MAPSGVTPPGLGRAPLPPDRAAMPRRVAHLRGASWLWPILALAIGLAAQNTHLVREVIHEAGDQAADSFQVLEAKELDLIRGHYSKYAFNHPGPVMLYGKALGELVLHDALGLVRSPLVGQLGFVLGLNLVVLGAFGRTIAREAGTAASAGSVACAIVLLHLAHAWAEAPRETRPLWISPWAPHLLVLPYLHLLLSSARFGRGDLRAGTGLIIGSCLLVHGHLLGIAFAGISVAVGLLALAARRLRARDREHPVLRGREDLVRLAILFALVVASFGPWLLDHGRHGDRSPLALALGHARASDVQDDGGSLRDGLSRLARVWLLGKKPAATTVAAGLVLWSGLLALAHRRRSRDPANRVLQPDLWIQAAAGSLIGLVLLSRLATGNDYAFHLMIALPVLLASMLVASWLAHRASDPVVSAVVAIALVLVGIAPAAERDLAFAYPLDRPGLQPVLEEIERRRDGEGRVWVRSDIHWGVGIGLVLALERRGIPSCTDPRTQDVVRLVTDRVPTCPDEPSGVRATVHEAGRCKRNGYRVRGREFEIRVTGWSREPPANRAPP